MVVNSAFCAFLVHVHTVEKKSEKLTLTKVNIINKV